jgi:hypothetical protein
MSSCVLFGKCVHYISRISRMVAGQKGWRCKKTCRCPFHEVNFQFSSLHLPSMFAYTVWKTVHKDSTANQYIADRNQLLCHQHLNSYFSHSLSNNISWYLEKIKKAELMVWKYMINQLSPWQSLGLHMLFFLRVFTFWKLLMMVRVIGKTLNDLLVMTSVKKIW